MVKRDVVRQILSELPKGVQLVAAAKTRNPKEVIEAIESGVTIIGENYVQEAERAYEVVGNRAKWHFIGHLQKNKVKIAVRIFDMIETLDSVEIAREIDKRSAQIGRVMPVLIGINSGREKQKTGIVPEEVENLAKQISVFTNIRVMGLMTMGPPGKEAEDSRHYFAETRKLFENLKILNIANIDMQYLSMGMTSSYKIAIEEGANIVRIGSKIFEGTDDSNSRLQPEK